MRELLAHRLFVEDTKHGVLAMDGGHDGDAEIDQASLIANAETAVLRNAALGDVEFAHDLDTRNDRRIPFFGDRGHGVLQHTVDAVLDGEFLVACFDVNVAGAPFESVEDGGVDQLDDGRDIALVGSQAVDGKIFVGVFVVADDIEREAFGNFFQNALGLLGLLEQVGDLGMSGNLDLELFARAGQRVRRSGTICRGSASAISSVAVVGLNRDEVVAEHQIDGNGAEEFVVDLGGSQIDEFAAIAPGERLRLFGSLSISCGMMISVAMDSVSLTNVSAKREDWKVQSDQNEGDEDTHEDHDGGLDQGQHRRHTGSDIFFVELGHAGQHLRQRAGRFADLHHVDGETRERCRWW